VYAEWLKTQNKDPLAHIPAPFGDVKGCYKDGERFAAVHQKLQDPLSHIPTNPEGMYNVDGTGVQYNSNKYKAVGNNHPTVKPVALMRYLIKLVTPPNSKVLDPFAGSGSTGMAACELGHTFVGCELDPAYVDIAKRRIEGWIGC
jgi:DNA modification methylase